MSKFIETDNVVNSLAKGAFLVSGDKKYNVMTVAWGLIGIVWFKPVFMVPVRESRYTKEFIDKTGCFTISVPYNNKMKDAISFCGTNSGRDVDKFKSAGLSVKKAKSIDTAIIDGCDMYYECKVLYKTDMVKDEMLPDEAKHYEKGNMHTMYFAEIVNSYTK